MKEERVLVRPEKVRHFHLW